MLRSYVNENIEIRPSPIHGMGMYAKTKIEKDDVVYIKGGHILHRDEFFSSGTINSYLPIDDNFVIAATSPEEEAAIKLFNNHSCNPNCGLRGEITFVAIKDIDAGEELTCDYAFIDNEDYGFECNCGSQECRKSITGYDWKLPQLQERYGRYFSVYLQHKFE